MKTEAEKDVLRWINQAAWRISGHRAGEREYEEIKALIFDGLASGRINALKLDELTAADLSAQI